MAFGAPRVTVAKPKPAQVSAVSHVKALKSHFAKAPAQPKPFQATKTTWPAAGTTRLALAAPAAGQKSGPRVTGSGAPVWGRSAVNGPRSLTVKVLDRSAAQAADIPGVLFTVSGDKPGPARVGLDYGDFAQAYGGNYGMRLGLVSYPSCVLTTPKVAACEVGTPVVSTNDPASTTVSATVTVKSAAVVLAATDTTPAENGSPGGSYAATSLSASGSWSGGGSTGDFSYSYPIAAPSAPSTLVPSVGLSYSSGATDGENATTQPQSSWLGEGWNTPDSFIEQSFQNCSESPEGTAAPTKTYDQCYDGAIYSMSLKGSSTALVWDSSAKVFKSETADGSVVKHFCTLPSGATSFTDPTCVAGTSNATSTKFNDWWQVIDRDGTTYSFGMNHLPGWASGKAATNSVATEPVYSAHSGDPCYSSSGMSASVCTVPYRWGLDYAADLHGNAMSYYYDQDTNYYGSYNGATMRSYVRDEHLNHVDYGFTDGNAYGTVPDKIVFNTGARCVSGTCTPLSATTKANWPDVPYDEVCASGATCSAHTPSFFSTVRLTGITTQQYVVSSAAYTTIDAYAFTQTMPQTGDGTSPTLWLSSVQRTGSALAAGPSGGAAITMPPVTFTPSVQMDSRLDTVTDGLPAFKKYRLQTITTETGSQITVAYGLPNPCSASAKPTAASNTSSCYPVSWTPEGYSAPITDWFNKYAVTMVTQTDPTGGASQQTTSYQYVGGAAWHYDDNEMVKAKYRTYGQFRGYGDVITYLGDGVTDARAKSETTFYRGMSKNNSTTAVTLTDSQGGTHEDVDQLAGDTLESTGYLGSDVDHSTISSYWVSGALATRTRTGLPDLTSTWSAPVETYTRQAVTSASGTTWRYTETDTSYDATVADANFGLATRVYKHTVPVNAAYSTCTSNTYAAANTTENLVGLESEVETDAVACGGYTAGSKPSAPGSVNALTAPSSVSRPAQVVSDTRTFYDDTAFATTFPQAAAPAKGDVTMTRVAADYTGGAFTWQTSSRAKYDTVGRQTDSYDGNGNNTHTAFTSNSVGLTTGMTVTNALTQSTSKTLDVQRGLTLTSTDPNSVVTTEQYDALGRVTKVWLDSRATSTLANYVYTYAVADNGPTAVTTQTLDDETGYRTETAIYDGLFRPRQTQTETPRGGRLVTDTFYDTRGWVSAKYTDWWDSANTPSTAIASAADLKAAVPMQNVFTYDSLGRQVVDHNEKNGVEISRTTTVYNGDRTTVVPPDGGTVTSTVVDPLGRTSEVDNYVSRPVLTSPSDPFTGFFTVSGGTSRQIFYGYDQHGNQNSTTQGGGGPAWTTTYNLLGQVTAKTDPDAGNATGLTYDADGNLTQSTDARGKTTSFTYDALNRETGSYDSAVAAQTAGPSGNQLGQWIYDNSNGVSGLTHAIGQLTTENTYVGGATYTAQQIDFNVFGEPVGTTTTIPDAEGALAGTYTVKHTYTTTTGLLQYDVYPAIGGLPKEQVLHTYKSQFDLPNGLGGLTSYAQSTSYDAFSRVNELAVGHSATIYTTIDNTYDENSGRLTDRLTDHTDGSTTTAVDEQKYSYDLSGNITGQTSTRLGAAATSETQCYQYDGLDQLTQAWTANDQCAAAPTSSTVADNLGASAAYWTTWTVDSLGDRTAQTRYGIAAAGTTDTTTTYTYGTNGAQPHTLTATSTTGGTTASTSYGYDAAGNMKTRNAGQGNQTINYDDAGNLTTVLGSTGGNTSYEYTADGDLLIQKDPGTNTLYLGDQQFALNTGTGAVTGTRYYSLSDGSQAIRTGSGTTAFTYAIADQHGTPSLYLDNTGTTPNWRLYTPYGGTRGDAVTAPDNHGFLNKPMDTTTGLTVVGARQYDPDTGRFITDDPVLEQTDPTQLNGYGYAGNNPVVHADPTGLMFPVEPSGGSACDQACQDTAAAAVNNSNSGSGNGGGSSNGGGALSSPKPKHKHWWQRANDWVNDHQGMIAGAVVGFVAFDACMGSTFAVGSVGCLALAGAAAKVTSDLVDGNIHNAGDLATSVGVGAVEGVLSPGIAALDLVNQGNAVVNDVKSGDYAGAAGHVGLAAVDVAAVKGAKGCNSLLPVTGVLMADGSTKEIKDVKVGDEVVSTNPDTGQTVDEPVILLHDNLDTDFLDLTVDADGKTSTIHTTQHHPIWDETTKKWTDAVDLHVGDKLHSTTGAEVTVTRVRAFAGAHHMFNLTVDVFHTYYVLADDTPVLVHNCPTGDGGGGGGGGFLSRLFGGGKSRSGDAAHEPNATVGDLRGIGHDNVDHNGNWVPDPAKQADARALSDPELVLSTTHPRDGDMTLLRYHDEDNYMIEGNHRMAELLRRADSAEYPKITDETRIYIHFWPGSGG